jgi:flagellar motor switch protein FliM
MRAQLQDADVDISSSLAQGQITLRALSQLMVGDVLPIDLPKELSLEVEGTSLFAGEFGTHNGRNAIKITHVHQPRSLIPLDSLG